MLSGKEVNTNFSHWFYPNGEQTRSLIHLSRAISSTSPGRSYALIDIDPLYIHAATTRSIPFLHPEHNYNSSLFDTFSKQSKPFDNIYTILIFATIYINETLTNLKLMKKKSAFTLFRIIRQQVQPNK